MIQETKHRNAMPWRNNQPQGLREFRVIDNGMQSNTHRWKKQAWPNHNMPRVGQQWSRPKLVLNITRVMQENHQAEEAVEENKFQE